MAWQPFPTLDHVIQRPAKAGTFGGSPIGQHSTRNDYSEVWRVRVWPSLGGLRNRASAFGEKAPFRSFLD
jgi:hypothetical protein